MARKKDKLGKLGRAIQKHGKSKKDIADKRRDVMYSTPEDYGYKEADTSDLDSRYEDYKMERDSLAGEERKEARGVKKRARMLSAIGKAANALGKIGAARSGGLVSGDLVPELDYGQGELDELEDKYDTKRLTLSERGRGLKKESEDLTKADRAALKAARQSQRDAKKEVSQEVDEEARREAEARERKRAKKEEERIKKKIAKEDKAVKREYSKYAKKSDKVAEDFIEEVSDGLDDDSADGESIVEAMEKLDLDPEIIEEFEAVPGDWGGLDEDEAAQKAKLIDLKQRIIMNMTRNRIKKDIELGVPVSPRIIEAFGLTEDGKDVKIEESKPTKVAAGESKAESGGADNNPLTFQYKIYEKGNPEPITTHEITAEKADDIREDPKVEKVVRIKLK